MQATTPVSPDLLYLSTADIAALAIGPAEILGAVEAILRQKTLGRTFQKPKLAVDRAPGVFAQAMVAIAEDPPLSAVKWLGVNGGNPRFGLPVIHATVILSDADTGRPRTVMNAGWLTGVRTAACSAAAARALARPGSETVAFVGCGVQAHTHLAALRPLFPGLRRARLLGRSAGSIEALAQAVEAAGLTVERVSTPQDALQGADIVVSTVSDSPGLQPFLDPRVLGPGAFVTAVDLGRSWLQPGWGEAFALTVTDDRQQSAVLGQTGKMAFTGVFDAEVGDLVAGTHPGRADATQRCALVFAGSALADLAVAALIDRRARAQGIGTVLPP